LNSYINEEVENALSLDHKDGGVTVVTLRAEPFGASDSERAFFSELCSSGSLREGYGGTFEQLATYLGRA
jgi:hypothetical protein